MRRRELPRFRRDPQAARQAGAPARGATLSQRPGVPPRQVIAIDGPAASGKSTTAKAVASELGALHLDSGSLYRALTAIWNEPPPDVEVRWPYPIPHLLRLAESRGLELREHNGSLIPFLDGIDAEPRLRSEAVNHVVSLLSAAPEARRWVDARLREAATGGRTIVVDGRDIGTVVFPDAAVKIFLTATPEARARRRLLQRGGPVAEAQIDREAVVLAERDRKDSERAVAPLRQAEDAIVLDTTELDFRAQVREIVRLVRERLPGA